LNQNAEHQWPPQNEDDDEQQADTTPYLNLPKIQQSAGGQVVCALVLLSAALAEHVCQYLFDVDPFLEQQRGAAECPIHQQLQLVPVQEHL
jgi:hypothetical protein